jgi:hypothetical protein
MQAGVAFGFMLAFVLLVIPTCREVYDYESTAGGDPRHGMANIGSLMGLVQAVFVGGLLGGLGGLSIGLLRIRRDARSAGASGSATNAAEAAESSAAARVAPDYGRREEKR